MIQNNKKIYGIETIEEVKKPPQKINILLIQPNLAA